MSNSPLVDFTLISPHKTSPRVYPITKITIHHMAGDLTVEQCGQLFQRREAASNYGIDNKGRVGMYVEEKDRAWCSANYDNDHRAINIELANDGGEPNWHVSDKVIQKCIELCVDICKRNGIDKLIFTGDKNGNLTQHNYFVNTACPGPYLKTKFGYIAEEVNRLLNKGEDKVKYILKIGFASIGDIKTFSLLLNSLGVVYTTADGYITTGQVTASEKEAIDAKGLELGVPVVVTAKIEPSGDDGELLAEVKELKEALKAAAIAFAEALK